PLTMPALPAPSSEKAMPRLLRTRLSAMMFLIYCGLGAWSVTAGTYLLSSPIKGGLNFTTGEVGWIYSTFALGAMLATPFVWPLFALLLAQAVCLQVALPLSTVLSLRNLPDRDQFSRVRLFGTVGWIAVGMTMGLILNPVSSDPFLLAGAITLTAAVYGFLLL